jgi:hypothetical protein
MIEKSTFRRRWQKLKQEHFRLKNIFSVRSPEPGRHNFAFIKLKSTYLVD